MFLPLFSGLTKKEMRDVFGILLLFMGAVTGVPSRDHVVCSFTESNQCYVALGQRLLLLLPLEDLLQLKFTDKTNTDRVILNIRQTQTNLPRWQFVNDNKTMILTSVERSDSGTYTVDAFAANGDPKGIYTLQVIIQDVPLAILSTLCVLFIVLVVLAFYIYKKRQGVRNKKDPAQDENIGYATVITSPSQKKNENEVQYSELVFNTPAPKNSEMPKVQDECVYAQIQHSQCATHSLHQ